MSPPPQGRLCTDNPLMQPLITAFVARLAPPATELRRAHAASDPQSLRRNCHQPKGSGKSFGFAPISTHAAAALEKLHAGLPAQSLTPDITALLAYIEQIGYSQTPITPEGAMLLAPISGAGSMPHVQAKTNCIPPAAYLTT